jgi:N-methylhydantoinase B
MNYRVAADGATPLPSKLTMTIRRGDVFRHEVAGAGGWGDPLERDPDSVLRDLRNEFISPTVAREAYGVVQEDGRMDKVATQCLRDQLRMTRDWTTTPAVSR